MQIPIYIAIFIFGSILGSFYNVVIYRLPRKESIVVGSSHCPSCNTPIKPYDLIPVLSYFILGGKCRNCKKPYSFRYPLVEFITGLLFVLTYFVYGYTWSTLIGIILASVLLIITLIDIDTMEIYDTFQVILFILALAFITQSELPLGDHLIGFFIISVPFYIIAIITNGMGGGDIKLIAMGGLLLGWKATLVAFFIASITGGIVAILLVLLKQQGRKSLIAFGPYLCLGIYIAFLYGNTIFDWYLKFYS
jgi:leader peptidase (prepilin peptidase) / N-methyltransferase